MKTKTNRFNKMTAVFIFLIAMFAIWLMPAQAQACESDTCRDYATPSAEIISKGELTWDVNVTYRFKEGGYYHTDEVTGEKIYCTPVYRLYNTNSSEHLFTTDVDEYIRLQQLTLSGQDYWVGEDINWYAINNNKFVDDAYQVIGTAYSDEWWNTNTTAIYRLYNASLGAMGKNSHYYTSDEAEITNLTTKHGWVKEFVAFYSYGDTPIYTAYSEALGSQHHYTANKTEWQGLDGGWDKEVSKNGSAGFFSGVCVPNFKTQSEIDAEQGTDTTTDTTKDTTTETTKQDTATTHTHNWTPVYKYVYHEPTTTVEPVYETKTTSAVYCMLHDVPNVTQEEYDADPTRLGYCSANKYCMANTTRKYFTEKVDTGQTQSVTTPGYQEALIDYYKCSCGATK